MELLFVLSIFASGWVCGQFFMTYKLRRAIKKIAEENGMTLEEIVEMFDQANGLETRVIKVPNFFTEVADNSILLYNKDTGRFMGQAKTIEELAEHIYKFEKVKFALVNHESKQFWFVEGKIRDDLKELQ
jgi:hypothetical protein